PYPHPQLSSSSRAENRNQKSLRSASRGRRACSSSSPPQTRVAGTCPFTRVCTVFGRPNNGMVAPRSKADVSQLMQAQPDAPPDMHCKDKFLVQSAIVAKEIMPKEVTGDMFTKDSVNIVDEVKLKVVYTAPSFSAPFALISKLMEEKNSAVELNNKLRQEL
ncbi:hypothetical protein ACJX0J_042482, partial [Zea mays]